MDIFAPIKKRKEIIAETIRSNLFAKLSLVLLLILIILGAIQVTFFAEFAERYHDAIEQLVQENQASLLAKWLTPRLQSSAVELKDLLKLPDNLLLDPRLDIFLVDMQGDIIGCFNNSCVAPLPSICTEPIEQFIAGTKQFPIYGNNPRDTKDWEVFSAARINYKGKPAYIYALLGNEKPFHKARVEIRIKLALRNMTFFVFLGLLVSGAVGILSFSFLTTPLGRISSIIERFWRGNLNERIPVVSIDEIGRVSAAFNKMADTISSNITQLEKTDLLRRELVSNIAHDLRGPLTSMLGYAQTLVESGEQLPLEARHKAYQTILRNITNLSKLVEDLFELAKLEAEDRIPKPKPFSLNEFLPDLVCKFEHLAKQKKIELNALIEPNLPSVSADISLIERAMSNLVENGILNSPPGQAVLIAAQAGKSRVTIKIKDTGSGISAEDLPHVFERFYRGNRGETKKGDGSGLGLAIVKKIMDAHGIKISVESELNQGTEFRFELPLAKSI